MDITREGRIAGVLEDTHGGRVHELSDGSRWRQKALTSDYVDQERLRDRLLRHRGAGLIYLDAEGTAAPRHRAPSISSKRGPISQIGTRNPGDWVVGWDR